MDTGETGSAVWVTVSRFVISAANRFFVHSAVADEFVAKFGAAIEELAVAPVISAKALEGVEALVTEAVAAGAIVTYCWVGLLTAAADPVAVVEQAVLVAAALAVVVLAARRRIPATV